MPAGPVQMSLFDERSRQALAAGGFVAGMKAAMRRAVEGSGLSRPQVVDAMNDIVRLTGGKGLCKGSKFLSLDTFEKWLASEERGQLPDLWGLHVLMLATGKTPMEVWAQLFDCSLLDAEGRKKLELMELELELDAKSQRRRQLRRELREKK